MSFVSRKKLWRTVFVKTHMKKSTFSVPSPFSRTKCVAAMCTYIYYSIRFHLKACSTHIFWVSTMQKNRWYGNLHDRTEENILLAFYETVLPPRSLAIFHHFILSSGQERKSIWYKENNIYLFLFETGCRTDAASSPSAWATAKYSVIIQILYFWQFLHFFCETGVRPLLPRLQQEGWQAQGVLRILSSSQNEEPTRWKTHTRDIVQMLPFYIESIYTFRCSDINYVLCPGIASVAARPNQEKVTQIIRAFFPSTLVHERANAEQEQTKFDDLRRGITKDWQRLAKF